MKPANARVRLARALNCALLFGLSACQRDADPQVRPDSVQLSSEPPAPEPPFAPEKVEFGEAAMGTRVRLIAYTTREVKKPAVLDAMVAAHAEIQRLEALMSSWRDDTDVAAINAHPGTYTAVHAETLEVIQKSQWVAELSDGAFDISFNAMHDVWKFGDGAEASPKLPDPAVIKERLRHVDYRKIEVDAKNSSVRIQGKMRIGLGGIAKGYAVDRAAHVLLNAGVVSFLAQAGGDLYGRGRKPDGSSWSAGVRDPRGAEDAFFATIALEDHAFSTAGDYARSFVIDGKRYHHIIDPKTGYPATLCRSVTIWAEDALTADAVDDAVFILGPKRGLELVESLPGVGAVIVAADNRVWSSKRLEGAVRLHRQPTDAP
jgi:thiamine biosynthesis lipoprotein